MSIYLQRKLLSTASQTRLCSTMNKILEHYKEQLIRELARVAQLPQVKEENSNEGDEIVLRYRPIVLDRSWMDDAQAASTDSQYNKLMAAVGNLNIVGIEDLDVFIGAMNNFLTRPVDISDHTLAISRVDILRTFYHLLTSPNEQSKGYDFEHFLAHIFGGQQLSVNAQDGIVDVEFPATNIAAKFIRPGGVIKGSMKDLMKTLESDRGVNFLVATKGQKKERGVVNFYTFVVDRTNVEMVPQTKKGQMNLSIKKLRDNADVFGFEEISNSPLDLRGCLERTEEILLALNEKFQNLLSELQSLVDQVDDLMYKAKEPKETKASARGAKEKAEKVRSKASDIESGS